MTILTEASHEFMSRPEDERFTSLTDLHAFTSKQHSNSIGKAVSSRKIEFAPTDDKKGLLVVGKGNSAIPTHWSFGQLATLSGVPSRLLRTQCENGLAELAADNLNAGFKVIRDVEEVGVLFRKETKEIVFEVDTESRRLTPNRVQWDDPASHAPVVRNAHDDNFQIYENIIKLAAATGPNYGRIWNSDVTNALVKRFGNGIDDTDWTVPGFFGVPLEQITKANTTLFASDRDMFVFLADEKNRITLPNRRNGSSGSLARGFFVWNSEVGNKTLGIAFFLFDYSCCNRIVWGVEEFQRIAVRHTSGAPDRWIEELHPTLVAYAHASASPIEARLKAAQQTKIDNAEDFLLKRFSKGQVAGMMAVHMQEEEKEIETLWDATTAITAYAKNINNTDDRVAMEMEGGKLLELVRVETTIEALAEAF